MAKIIKYQLVAAEIPHEVVVKVPLLDENNEPVMEEVVTPVYDEDGEVTFETKYEPVMVDEIKEEVEIALSDVSISCRNQESFDLNLPIAQAEAYNGEYTVEGEFDQPKDTTTTDDVLNALLGVNE